MNLKSRILLILTTSIALLTSNQVVACGSVAEYDQDWAARLNSFWKVRGRICDKPNIREAAAYPNRRLVLVDSLWLAELSADYGYGAAEGVIAHEWAHLIQPRYRRPIERELQADCLAGFAMGALGLSRQELDNFARASFYHGDYSFHGTPAQRANAAWRGYDAVGRFSYLELMSRVCPPGRYTSRF
jgi:hypothetical protein